MLATKVFLIISSFLIFCLLLCLILKFLKLSGCKLPRKFDFLISKTEYSKCKTITWNELSRVFAFALLFRILIYLASAIAIRIFMDDATPLTLSGFLNQWQQWDAINYIKIAELGYAKHLVDGMPIYLVFFPLYSWIIRYVNLIFHNYQVTAMVISSICYCIGSCYLYALVKLDYGKNIAKRAVIFISIFPFAFHFGGIMTESIFFLTSVACFYYIKKHNWVAMLFWGILCSLSRMHGILLIVAAGIEMFQTYKPFAMIRKKRFKLLSNFIFTKLIILPFIGTGTAIYLMINYVVGGSPFQFAVYQKQNWYMESTFFTNTLTCIFEYVFNPLRIGMTRASIWIPELALFVICLITLIYAVRKHSTMYVAYLFVYLMLNYSLSWLISGPRYMSCAIPMFIIWAEYAEKHEWADRWITIISALFMGIYITGFLFQKQII